LVLAVYIPLYASYSSGCASSNNGTLLSHNSYAFLYNYASIGGNTRMMLRLAEYESTRALACGRYQERFLASEARADGRVAVSAQQQQTAYAHLALIHKCLDGDVSFDPMRLPANSDPLADGRPHACAAADLRYQRHIDVDIGVCLAAIIRCSCLAIERVNLQLLDAATLQCRESVPRS
jgi:hypothetical protein